MDAIQVISQKKNIFKAFLIICNLERFFHFFRPFIDIFSLVLYNTQISIKKSFKKD